MCSPKCGRSILWPQWWTPGTKAKGKLGTPCSMGARCEQERRCREDDPGIIRAPSLGMLSGLNACCMVNTWYYEMPLLSLLQAKTCGRNNEETISNSTFEGKCGFRGHIWEVRWNTIGRLPLPGQKFHIWKQRVRLRTQCDLINVERSLHLRSELTSCYMA